MSKLQQNVEQAINAVGAASTYDVPVVFRVVAVRRIVLGLAFNTIEDEPSTEYVGELATIAIPRFQAENLSYHPQVFTATQKGYVITFETRPGFTGARYQYQFTVEAEINKKPGMPRTESVAKESKDD